MVSSQSELAAATWMANSCLPSPRGQRFHGLKIITRSHYKWVLPSSHFGYIQKNWIFQSVSQKKIWSCWRPTPPTLISHAKINLFSCNKTSEFSWCSMQTPCRLSCVFSTSFNPRLSHRAGCFQPSPGIATSVAWPWNRRLAADLLPDGESQLFGPVDVFQKFGDLIDLNQPFFGIWTVCHFAILPHWISS